MSVNGESPADPSRGVVAQASSVERVLTREGHEGDDVDHAESGMNSFVGVEVEGLERLDEQFLHVARQVIRAVHQCEDRAIVVGVTVAVA